MKQKTRDTICVICCIIQLVVCVILKLTGVIKLSWLLTILLPFGIGFGLTVLAYAFILILIFIAYVITFFIKGKKK